jgi:hypothetical protein
VGRSAGGAETLTEEWTERAKLPAAVRIEFLAEPGGVSRSEIRVPLRMTPSPLRVTRDRVLQRALRKRQLSGEEQPLGDQAGDDLTDVQ